MLHKILLTVQVCDIHDIKINQMQMADTDSCKCICYIGTKPAKSCNRHTPL